MPYKIAMQLLLAYWPSIAILQHSKYSFMSNHSVAAVALEFCPLFYTYCCKVPLLFFDVYKCFL